MKATGKCRRDIEDELAPSVAQTFKQAARTGQASDELQHLLLHCTSEPALDRDVNAGWQMVVERWNRRFWLRSAGLSSKLLQFDHFHETPWQSCRHSEEVCHIRENGETLSDNRGGDEQSDRFATDC